MTLRNLINMVGVTAVSETMLIGLLIVKRLLNHPKLERSARLIGGQRCIIS